MEGKIGFNCTVLCWFLCNKDLSVSLRFPLMSHEFVLCFSDESMEYEHFCRVHCVWFDKFCLAALIGRPLRVVASKFCDGWVILSQV